MKAIKLKATKEVINGQETIFTTYHLLKMVVNNPTEKGFDVEEMMQRLKIMNVIDEHKEWFEIADETVLKHEVEISFEDTDFKKIAELYRQMKWTVISQSIIDLKKQIDEAK